MVPIGIDGQAIVPTNEFQDRITKIKRVRGTERTIRNNGAAGPLKSPGDGPIVRQGVEMDTRIGLQRKRENVLLSWNADFSESLFVEVESDRCGNGHGLDIKRVRDASCGIAASL